MEKSKFISLYTDTGYFSHMNLKENQNIVSNYTKNRVYLHILSYFFCNIGRNINLAIFLLTIIKRKFNQERVIWNNPNLRFYTLIYVILSISFWTKIRTLFVIIPKIEYIYTFFLIFSLILVELPINRYFYSPWAKKK